MNHKEVQYNYIYIYIPPNEMLRQLLDHLVYRREYKNLNPKPETISPALR